MTLFCFQRWTGCLATLIQCLDGLVISFWQQSDPSPPPPFPHPSLTPRLFALTVIEITNTLRPLAPLGANYLSETLWIAPSGIGFQRRVSGGSTSYMLAQHRPVAGSMSWTVRIGTWLTVGAGGVEHRFFYNSSRTRVVHAMLI